VSILSILTWAAFGAIVGSLARAIVPTSRLSAGLLPTIALGVVGSIAGGLPTTPRAIVVLGSVVGAVAVVMFHSWYTESNQ